MAGDGWVGGDGGSDGGDGGARGDRDVRRYPPAVWSGIMPNRTATSQNETAAPRSEPTAPHAKAKPTPRIGRGLAFSLEPLEVATEAALALVLPKAVVEAEAGEAEGGERAWLITVTASESGSTVLQHAS